MHIKFELIQMSFPHKIYKLSIFYFEYLQHKEYGMFIADGKICKNTENTVHTVLI